MQHSPTEFQSDSLICVLSITKLGRGRFNGKEEGLVEILVVRSRFFLSREERTLTSPSIDADPDGGSSSA